MPKQGLRHRAVNKKPVIEYRHQRTKGRYKTARGAWGSIARETGKHSKDVVRRTHSATHWVFITK